MTRSRLNFISIKPSRIKKKKSSVKCCKQVYLLKLLIVESDFKSVAPGREIKNLSRFIIKKKKKNKKKK